MSLKKKITPGIYCPENLEAVLGRCEDAANTAATHTAGRGGRCRLEQNNECRHIAFLKTFSGDVTTIVTIITIKKRGRRNKLGLIGPRTVTHQDTTHPVRPFVHRLPASITVPPRHSFERGSRGRGLDRPWRSGRNGRGHRPGQPAERAVRHGASEELPEGRERRAVAVPPREMKHAGGRARASSLPVPGKYLESGQVP